MLNQSKKKKGFTLTEVMVALSIMSILTPAILSTFIFFNRLVVDGVERNTNMGQIRRLELFFTKKVSSTQRTAFRIDGAGTQVFFNIPTSSGGWEDASILYRVNSKDMVFITTNGSKRILTDAYPLNPNSSRIFSKNGTRVTCRLRVGKKDKQAVEVRFLVSARN